MVRFLEIRDPVHNYIVLNQLEKIIVDTPAFQRLRNIKQLAAAYVVYPGATHTRFDHSLGVLHIAGKMARHLQSRGYVDHDGWQLVRLSGLLHDIGHGPFSHVFEQVMVMLLGKTHEDITCWLLEHSEIKETLEEQGFTARSISKILKGRDILSQLIKGCIDADKLDFLVRDSHFTGVEYGRIDVYRLIYSSEICEDMIAIDYGGLAALESFLIARYEMFKAVYYHKTVRAAELMLIKAIEEAAEHLGIDRNLISDPQEYLRLDDVQLTYRLRMLREEEDESTKKAYKLFKEFEQRRLLKVAYEKVVETRDEFLLKLIKRPSVIRNIEAEIAEKADLDPGYVIVDSTMLPSIPYKLEDASFADVPIVEKENGKIQLVGRASQMSILYNVLRKYLDVIRVYTYERYRTKVAKAATDMFGEPFISQRVSY